MNPVICIKPGERQEYVPVNKENMQEIGHYFGIGQTTVLSVLKRINADINNSLS